MKTLTLRRTLACSLIGSALAACGAADESEQEPSAATSSSLLGSGLGALGSGPALPLPTNVILRPPGLVLGLVHNLNQTAPGTVMYSADPAVATHRDGGDLEAGNHRGFEWWSLPDPSPAQDPAPYDQLLPPGVVVALRHNGNQNSQTITAFGQDPVSGPATMAGFVRQHGGDWGAPGTGGYFWYESTGTKFTNWAGIDQQLPKYTIVGLKHAANQPNKVLVWNGYVYDPVKPSPVPAGYRRRVGGDLGASAGKGFYWYEKISGTELVKQPKLESTFVFGQSLFNMGETPSSVDMDGDRLIDAREADLAYAFRPYVIFDDAEHARQDFEPVAVFRMYPTSATSVHVRWLLLFADDGGYGPASSCTDGHPGDNDSIDYDLYSLDGKTWSLGRVELSSKGINWPSNSRLEVYANQHPIVYLSGSKHHEYLTRDNDGQDSAYSNPEWFIFGWEDCDDDINGNGPAAFVTIDGFLDGKLNNVGEPLNHPAESFVNSLDAYFPNYTIWGGENFYSEKCGTNKGKFVCPHDPCTEGDRLTPSCFPEAALICSFDPFCCNTAWDWLCVQEVSTGCERWPF